MESLTVVFAGGGSGGHLFPALAVDAALRDVCESVWSKYFCSERKIDASLLSRADVDYEPMPSESSAHWMRPWRIILKNWRGYRLAKRRLRELRPDCVVGCGGFASLPVVLAARSLRLPIVLLEQNQLPGRATRWLAKHADCICISFAETEEFLKANPEKIVVTGNPVRSDIVKLRESSERKELDANQLLILGGSLGSQTLNSLVVPVLIQLNDALQNWQIVHQVGGGDSSEIAESYRKSSIQAEVVPFVESIEDEYVRSSLVLSRAGATTLAELACLGLPAVLVPFAAARDDHQTHNARWFAERNAAALIKPGDADVCRQQLRECLDHLLRSDEVRSEMSAAMFSLGRPRAAHTIAECLIELVAG